MRPRLPRLLAASMALNVVVASLLVADFRRGRPNGEREPTPGRRAVTAENAAPATWAAFDTNELPELTSRLRGAGFPPEVVEAVVRVRVEEQFAARQAALDAETERIPFWLRPRNDPRTRAAQLAIDRDKEKLLRESLAGHAELKARETQSWQKDFDYIAPEKIGQVRALVEQFHQQQREQLAASGVNGPFERVQARALEKEHRAALAGILTPGELEDHAMRTSRTAWDLRRRLERFGATDEEFRALFRLRLKHEDEFPPDAQVPPDQMSRLGQANLRLNQQIQAALGPVRYNDYQRSLDHQHTITENLVARLGLPPETARRIWEVRQQYEPLVTALRQNRALDRADRLQQQAVIQREAMNRIEPLLGDPARMESFLEYGGAWLKGWAPLPEKKQ